jgi:hypothetical protein
MVFSGEKPVKMFDVYGPFPVTRIKGKKGQRISRDQRFLFWDEHTEAENLRERVGCYVFAIRAAKGIRPVYVGKTIKSFEKEIFQDHKILKYNEELMDIVSGTPVMFFVVHPDGRGIPNSKMIGDMEDFLIQVAVAKNPSLRNIRGVAQKAWGIQGVLRAGKGSTTKSSSQFKKAMGLHPR